MDVKTASHPLNPPDQWTSRGQKRETGELVNRRSPTTCERMIRKQFVHFILGIRAQSLQAFAARTPASNANIRLWVGPRWKAQPLPWIKSPAAMSTSGRLERMDTNRMTFQSAKEDLRVSKSFVVNPITAWPRGSGIPKAPCWAKYSWSILIRS